jgi:hypothetical protein
MEQGKKSLLVTLFLLHLYELYLPSNHSTSMIITHLYTILKQK